MNTTEQINALVLNYGLSETVKLEIIKIVENQKINEVSLTHDNDGDIFCAFVDKLHCIKEAKESGCSMKTVRLIWNY